MHDFALPVAAGIRSRWRWLGRPAWEQVRKFGRAPLAQELASGFGTGRLRSSHRLRVDSGQEFAGRLPCPPAPSSAFDPVFLPGRPSGRLGLAEYRRIRRDFKRVCEPVTIRNRMRAAMEAADMASSRTWGVHSLTPPPSNEFLGNESVMKRHGGLMVLLCAALVPLAACRRSGDGPRVSRNADIISHIDWHSPKLREIEKEYDTLRASSKVPTTKDNYGERVQDICDLLEQAVVVTGLERLADDMRHASR